jgi:thiol-disulfide isomerase/thioredoxin
VLGEKTEAASPAVYRMEVRTGAVLRMRAILTTIAGRVYLATRAAPAERAAYQALRECEDLTLASTSLGPPEAAAATPEPFPPYDEDLKLAEAVLPAWMGIRFRQANMKLRQSFGLKDGAAAVVAVFPDSPANGAGFEVGDIVIGPPGRPLTEPNQIREWTMLSKIGRAAPLAVLRDGRRLRLTLVPQPYPLEWPELPGPPKIGSATPKLDLAAYRGALPASLADGSPHLLFFWATWCAPCKAALPEVLAFEQTQRTPVIAVTDELPEQLDTFFKRFDAPFPAIVAVDEYRRTFLAYGVSGTPTFVLVDGSSKVQSYSTGYSTEKGLGIEGWSWVKEQTPSLDR